jgi:hypothetical protein
MNVIVDPCGRKGHRYCELLERMRRIAEMEEPVDLDEADRLIEWVKVRERLLRTSRQTLEQRRMRDSLSEKMGRR